MREYELTGRLEPSTLTPGRFVLVGGRSAGGSIASVELRSGSPLEVYAGVDLGWLAGFVDHSDEHGGYVFATLRDREGDPLLFYPLQQLAERQITVRQGGA